MGTSGHHRNARGVGKKTTLTLEHPNATVTEMAPHRGHEPPRGGRQAMQTQQPQFRTTGSCSSCVQPGLAHRKSARLSRTSGWECTACDKHTHCCSPWPKDLETPVQT